MTPKRTSAETMATVTCERSTCERYYIKYKPHGWAVLLVDSALGMISIQSDWGDYQHWWPRHGRKSFKSFLVELQKDHHYLADKFTYGNEAMRRHLFLDETIKQLKRDLLNRRREGWITREEASHLWSEIETIDSVGPADASQFHHMMADTAELFSELYDNDHMAIPCVTGIHPRVYAFLENVWPPFVAQLLAEGVEPC